MAFASKVTRSFSTSSVNMKLARAPMQVFGLNGSYALALYSAASKKNQLDAVETEIKSLLDLWHNDTHMRDFFMNPVTTRQEKKSVFDTISKKKNYGELTKNLFGVIADHTRYAKMDGILKTYLMLMSAHRGEVQCEVVTAKPMDEATLKEVNAAIQGFMKSGQKMKISTKVDPSIIGGMIVSIGDKYVDMSIARKITEMTKVMEGSI